MGCLTAKASGTVASFINPTVTDIESARVYFSPTQLGEGTPSPENVREIVGRTEINFYHSGKNLAHIIGYSAINPDSNNTRKISNIYGTTINNTEFSLPDTKLVITQAQYPNADTPIAYQNGYVIILVDNLIWEQKYNISFKIDSIVSNPLNVSLNSIRLIVPNGKIYVSTEIKDNRLFFKNVVWKPNSTNVNRRSFEIRICGMSFTLSEFMVTPADDENYDFKPYQGGIIPFSWKRLPDEYQEVEYIESDGGQYIDSGIIPSTTDIYSFKGEFSNKDNSVLFGCRSSGTYRDSNQLYLNRNVDKNIKTVMLVTNTANNGDTTGYAKNVFFYRGDNLPLEIDGKNISIDGRTSASFNPTQSIYLLGFNVLGTNNETVGGGKLVYFKIDGRCNFIPCYRKSDNEIGMYDTVSQTFYTNQGTGTFTKGNDVFSDEVYGGYVDLVKGEIVATHYSFTLDGINYFVSSYGQTYTGTDGSLLAAAYDYISVNSFKNLPMGVTNSIPNSISNKYLVTGNNKIIGIQTASAGTPYYRLVVSASELDDISNSTAIINSLKIWLQNNPIQICYKLAEPITYQLPDYLKTQLQTLKNENTFWSNGDSVEIDYDLAETFDIQKAKRKIIMNQPHVESITGDAVSFTTDMKAPLKECKVSFMPVQEGEGDPSPTNVRNITGWNGVSVKNGENTYSVDWTDDAGTVYGGYVDLVSGILTATVKCINMETENWHCSSQSSVKHFYCMLDDKLYSQNEYIPCWCSCYNFWGNGISSVIYSGFADKEFGAQVTNGMIRLRDDSITDVTTFIESVSGQTLAYPLREPITYQLTPEQILSLKGINNFSCGIKNDMTVKYWKHKLSDSANVAYEAENLTFDGTNYIDTGVYLFSEKNINKDFEVVIEDLYGSTTSNNTIVCAKYNSTAIGFLIRLFGTRDTTYNGTIFMKKNNHNNITIRRINGAITIHGKIITNPTVQFTNAVHPHPLMLGCALEDNGTPYRYATGTIGHITVKWL